MNDKEIRSWAKKFAAELRVADQPGIFDQIVGKHLDTLESLKTRLRWKGIVNILTRAGARRADGKGPISEDQLRASRSRMRQRQRTNNARGAQSSSQGRAMRLTSSSKNKMQSAGDLPHRSKQGRIVSESKDVSAAEVSAALSRIARSTGRKP